MAARKTKRKTKAKVTQLPKGYTSIGGFGKTWPGDDTKIGDVLAGTVTEYDEVKIDGKMRDNLKLETADGEMFTVWGSAALRGLFEEDFTDVDIWLRYEGLGKKKRGQNPAKLFTIAADIE